MNISAADLQVVVTAGAAGIGLAIATTFADAGARVFAVSYTHLTLPTNREV